MNSVCGAGEREGQMKGGWDEEMENVIKWHEIKLQGGKQQICNSRKMPKEMSKRRYFQLLLEQNVDNVRSIIHERNLGL